MAWRGRRGNRGQGDETAGAVEVFAVGNGLIVEGTTTAVAAFIDQMSDATKAAGGQARHFVVDGLQIAANLAAFRQTHREYFEFSDRARHLLREHGAIPTADGNYRSFVRKGIQFAGNLDWKPVNLGPEQALGLQAAAGQLALRAAVKEITAALERVEDKIDTLSQLAEAERLGAVVADRATLQPLVDRARSTGKLSSTDWSTVAALGPLIARDVETLRAYILRQFKDVKPSNLVRSRAGEAEELTDRLLKESLALLVLAEQNYTLWQELRLAHTVNHEQGATASITSDIQAQLAALSAADQAVVDNLQDVIDRLTAATGYEGFAPLQKRRLHRHVSQLDEMNSWFCQQRRLDHRPSEPRELAGITESLDKVRGTIADRARTTGRAIAATPKRLRARGTSGDDASPPELNP